MTDIRINVRRRLTFKDVGKGDYFIDRDESLCLKTHDEDEVDLIKGGYAIMLSTGRRFFAEDGRTISRILTKIEINDLTFS